MNQLTFKSKIREFARLHKRDLPWRTPGLTPDLDGHLNLYQVLVSEVMLQQTQVARVVVKFKEFINKFPSLSVLTDANLIDVLKVWQGLGYNRRGKYLWEAARTLVTTIKTRQLNSDPLASNKSLIIEQFSIQELDDLPGIGPATAASIYCFTYNRPVVFIETNIRKVYIHHFCADRAEVDDSELLPLIRDTLDYENPREWYYALMDYGSFLSTVIANPNTKSRHYVKQSKFTGSDRQIRGRILRDHLSDIHVALSTVREKNIYKQLKNEGLIV